MTVYIHFLNDLPSRKIHNVSAVVDNGPHAVRIDMIFSDDHLTFENVRNVSCQPEE